MNDVRDLLKTFDSDLQVDWDEAEITHLSSREDEGVNIMIDERTQQTRIGEMHMETNNATHIQQFALALVDAGFQVHIEAQEDGFWVRVFWDDQVIDHEG